MPHTVKKKVAEKKHPTDANRKVGLRPKRGWHRRNFLAEVLIPSLFVKRTGRQKQPRFSELGPDQVCVTWIGHASFLLRTQAGNILIDPNWSNWLKVVKRMRRPGLKLHDLPPVDVVLITHAHFDHLDRRTLRSLAADQTIVVPSRVRNLVHDLGFQKVHELECWETYRHGGLDITLTPCHHWGARVLHDSHRGFGGYIVRSGQRSIYHCGDTAYFDGFQEIGRRHPIDIALLPIGSYDPPSGREVHMTPEQAAQAFVELGARTLVPMHYGTFRLSYEPMEEPPARLLASARKFGIEDKVCILDEGESVLF